MARMHFENYEFQRAKADNATATVYQFHYAMKDAGWHPGRTDDDLTEIIRAKGRELAQLSARQAAQDGWRLVPAEPTEEMVTAGQESLGVHDCYYAMLSAAPPPPEREPRCWCETCRPNTLSDMRFIVCPDCGNKRCPKATHHDNACTNSNAPGQAGSSWEHVKPHGATND